MRSLAKFVAAIGLIGALVASLACADTDEPAATTGDGTDIVTDLAEIIAASSAGSTQVVAGGSPGIWVSGDAMLSVEPDLVLLNVGVETIGTTVAEARAEAAAAMESIVSAVKARGLSDRDVQTTSFSIWPQYEYPEVMGEGGIVRKTVISGYTVSNSAQIKIRDIEAVGAIIDDVAAAGGDATRINGISFSIEDPSSFESDLRAEAVADARAKAEHLASLNGVTLGTLQFVAEGRAGTPYPEQAGYIAERALAAYDVSTPVSSGELTLRMSVQAAFAIE